MAKRFIDTGIYDDDWFMELSKDAKLLWLYFITKCDHAGMIKLNEKLCKVQTDIKELDKVIKELGDRIYLAADRLYFIPKFIEFQYPGFPKSGVRQQESAIEILKKYNLFDEKTLTLSKDLTNSHVTLNKELGKRYGHGNDNGNDNGNENENEKNSKKINVLFSDFWELYDKKVGVKTKLEKKWNALTQAERISAMGYLPRYKNAQPDKKYRKNPDTFLNNKSWNDEIISTASVPDRNSRGTKNINAAWSGQVSIDDEDYKNKDQKI
jgi:hypothetical protein